jgi:hypothetical protein
VCHIKGGTQAVGVGEWGAEGGIWVSDGELTGDQRRVRGEKLHGFVLSWCILLWY